MVILLICGKTPALLVTLFLVDSEQQQPPVVANKEEVTVIKTVPFPAAAATGSGSIFFINLLFM
jgi:hypothetical protein